MPCAMLRRTTYLQIHPSRSIPSLSYLPIHCACRLFVNSSLSLSRFPDLPAWYARRINKPFKLKSLLRLTSPCSCLDGDSFCQLPCMPSCLSSSASDKTALAQALLTVKVFYILRRHCSTPQATHNFPRKAFCSIISLHCPPFTACSHSFSRLCTSSVTTAASSKNLKLSSLHRSSQMCKGPARLADCARHNAQFLNFFLTKFFKPLLPRCVVLRFR